MLSFQTSYSSIFRAATLHSRLRVTLQFAPYNWAIAGIVNMFPVGYDGCYHMLLKDSIAILIYFYNLM